LLDNVPRTLPPGVKVVLEQSRWAVPPVMRELVRLGRLSHHERYRALNMGIGYTLVVPLADVAKAAGAVPGARVIGWVEARREGDAPVVIHPARDEA
jgi:phosphoribosylformylglycinamidine cyclo-ligase